MRFVLLKIPEFLNPEKKTRQIELCQNKNKVFPNFFPKAVNYFDF